MFLDNAAKQTISLYKEITPLKLIIDYWSWLLFTDKKDQSIHDNLISLEKELNEHNVNLNIVTRGDDKHNILAKYGNQCIAIILGNKEKVTSLENAGTSVVIVDLHSKNYIFPNLDRYHHIQLQMFSQLAMKVTARWLAISKALFDPSLHERSLTDEELITQIHQCINDSASYKRYPIAKNHIAIVSCFHEEYQEQIDRRFASDERFIIVTDNWKNPSRDHQCDIKKCKRPHKLQDIERATFIIIPSKKVAFCLGKVERDLLENNIFNFDDEHFQQHNHNLKVMINNGELNPFLNTEAIIRKYVTPKEHESERKKAWIATDHPDCDPLIQDRGDTDRWVTPLSDEAAALLHDDPTALHHHDSSHISGSRRSSKTDAELDTDLNILHDHNSSRSDSRDEFGLNGDNKSLQRIHNSHRGSTSRRTDISSDSDGDPEPTQNFNRSRKGSIISNVDNRIEPPTFKTDDTPRQRSLSRSSSEDEPQSDTDFNTLNNHDSSRKNSIIAPAPDQALDIHPHQGLNRKRSQSARLIRGNKTPLQRSSSLRDTRTETGFETGLYAPNDRSSSPRDLQGKLGLNQDNNNLQNSRRDSTNRHTDTSSDSDRDYEPTQTFNRNRSRSTTSNSADKIDGTPRQRSLSHRSSESGSLINEDINKSPNTTRSRSSSTTSNSADKIDGIPRQRSLSHRSSENGSPLDEDSNKSPSTTRSRSSSTTSSLDNEALNSSRKDLTSDNYGDINSNSDQDNTRTTTKKRRHKKREIKEQFDADSDEEYPLTQTQQRLQAIQILPGELDPEFLAQAKQKNINSDDLDSLNDIDSIATDSSFDSTKPPRRHLDYSETHSSINGELFLSLLSDDGFTEQFLNSNLMTSSRRHSTQQRPVKLASSESYDSLTSGSTDSFFPPTPDNDLFRSPVPPLTRPPTEEFPASSPRDNRMSPTSEHAPQTLEIPSTQPTDEKPSHFGVGASLYESPNFSLTNPAFDNNFWGFENSPLTEPPSDMTDTLMSEISDKKTEHIDTAKEQTLFNTELEAKGIINFSSTDFFNVALVMLSSILPPAKFAHFASKVMENAYDQYYAKPAVKLLESILLELDKSADDDTEKVTQLIKANSKSYNENQPIIPVKLTMEFLTACHQLEEPIMQKTIFQGITQYPRLNDEKIKNEKYNIPSRCPGLVLDSFYKILGLAKNDDHYSTSTALNDKSYYIKIQTQFEVDLKKTTLSLSYFQSTTNIKLTLKNFSALNNPKKVIMAPIDTRLNQHFFIITSHKAKKSTLKNYIEELLSFAPSSRSAVLNYSELNEQLDKEDFNKLKPHRDLFTRENQYGYEATNGIQERLVINAYTKQLKILGIRITYNKDSGYADDRETSEELFKGSETLFIPIWDTQENKNINCKFTIKSIILIANEVSGINKPTFYIAATKNNHGQWHCHCDTRVYPMGDPGDSFLQVKNELSTATIGGPSASKQFKPYIVYYENQGIATNEDINKYEETLQAAPELPEPEITITKILKQKQLHIVTDENDDINANSLIYSAHRAGHITHRNIEDIRRTIANTINNYLEKLRSSRSHETIDITKTRTTINNYLIAYRAHQEQKQTRPTSRAKDIDDLKDMIIKLKDNRYGKIEADLIPFLALTITKPIALLDTKGELVVACDKQGKTINSVNSIEEFVNAHPYECKIIYFDGKNYSRVEQINPQKASSNPIGL